jgi:hypothetical protein
MGNINEFRVDLELEKEGAWVSFTDEIELRIARHGNPKFQDAIRKETERRKAVLNVKELSEDMKVDVQKVAASEAILVDWRGLEDDGEAVPYTSEMALRYFRDPELRVFWQFVLMQSIEDSNYRKDRIKADAGN